MGEGGECVDKEALMKVVYIEGEVKCGVTVEVHGEFERMTGWLKKLSCQETIKVDKSDLRI